MARHARFEKRVVSSARKAAGQAPTIAELRAAQAVLLPAVHGLTMAQTGAAIGLSRASVGRLQQQSRKPKARGKPREVTAGWGGRRRRHLTWEEEVTFLQPWLAQARSAGLVVLSPVRAALAQQLGRPVKASMVWRLLGRHGWRKVAPAPRHPKGDPVAQEAWKKNSRRWWPGSSASSAPRGSACG